MLTLLTFAGSPNQPSLSNFCTKAMILLNMAQEDWQPRIARDMTETVFGKLPTLITEDGKVGDSNLLIPWLEARGADLFPGLTLAQRGQAHAVIRMVEENLRYGMMYDRWVDPDGWAAFCPVAFADMPENLRSTLPEQFRAKISDGFQWQGLGRFGPQERLAYFQSDLDALTALLQDGPFLFGDRPCAADAATLPVLSGIETLQIDSGLRQAVRTNPTLMRYIDHGRQALFAPLATSTGAAA